MPQERVQERVHAIATRDGVVGCLVWTDDARAAELPPVVAGDSRPELLLRELVRVLDVTGEASVRVMLERQVLMAWRRDGVIAGLAVVRGHPQGKSAARVLRKLLAAAAASHHPSRDGI